MASGARATLIDRTDWQFTGQRDLQRLFAASSKGRMMSFDDFAVRPCSAKTSNSLPIKHFHGVLGSRSHVLRCTPNDAARCTLNGESAMSRNDKDPTTGATPPPDPQGCYVAIPTGRPSYPLAPASTSWRIRIFWASVCLLFRMSVSS